MITAERLRQCDSLESLFFERLFFLVAPEFAAELSVA